MKTIKLILLLTLLVNEVRSQTIANNFNNAPYYKNQESDHTYLLPDTTLINPKNIKQDFEPIYFSYKKRQLIYKGQKIRGEKLVAICRNIPDSAIQEQINCYDNLSNNKKWILGSTIICGISAIILMNAATLIPSESNIYMSLTGLGAGLSSGITAICSSIPHQKRKIIMFRDLPIVYNQYVERQQHK